MKEYCQSTSTLHPLHLLDDLLESISSEVRGGNSVQLQDDETSLKNRDAATDVDMLSMAEAKQDLVLRAADELFCNNMTLLENALALIDEQEQYCKEIGNGDTSNNPTLFPVIRKIRAKRSGRTAILVRKQRKNNKSLYKKSKSAVDNNSDTSSQVNNSKKKQKVADEYYLCIMGKDKLLDQRSLLNSNNDSGGWGKIQRRGAHCTCRAFSQNIKGGNNGRSSQSQSSSSAKGSSNSRNEAGTAHSSNAVVCKHLLAAILIPHMLPWSDNETDSCGGGMEDEIVDDKEFAKLIMRASIG